MFNDTGYIYLTCTTDGSNKFYEIRQHAQNPTLTNTYRISIRYGRLPDTGPQRGTIKVYFRSSEAEASRFCRQKLNDKIDKGYVDTLPPAFISNSLIPTSTRILNNLQYNQSGPRYPSHPIDITMSVKKKRQTLRKNVVVEEVTRDDLDIIPSEFGRF